MKTKHRRAAHAKRTARDDLAMCSTIARSSVAMLTPDEIASCALPVRVGWEAIKTGKGSGHDLRVLAQALSVCMIAAEEIDPFLEETATKAAMALCNITERYSRLRKIGVDADALRDIPPALEFYDEILKSAECGKLFGWMEQVMRIHEKTAVRGEAC